MIANYEADMYRVLLETVSVCKILLQITKSKLEIRYYQIEMVFPFQIIIAVNHTQSNA